MFSSDDLAQLAERGIAPEDARSQLARIGRGFPGVCLDRPCTVGDGLLRIGSEQMAETLGAFERARSAGRIARFVPASGAASRMFQSLLSAAGSDLVCDPASLQALIGSPEVGREHAAASGLGFDDAQAAARFLLEIDRFPFARALGQALGLGKREPLRLLLESGRGRELLRGLLGEPGLGLAALPKGLIPFHDYPDGAWTPFGEHLAEAWELLGEGGASEPIGLHFTVPPGFEKRIRTHLEETAARIPEARFSLRLSVQSPASDTIAAAADGRPYRGADGRLVFRPGGHGALLANLAETRGDLVLVKNIDNIASRSWRRPQHVHRKLLAGLAVLLEERVASWRTELAGLVGSGRTSADPRTSAERTAELARLEGEYATTFSRQPAPDGGAASFEERVARLAELLDRPLRVCAMVPNVGEPGGGPFWVRHADGSVDIQIVELSQVDQADPGQRRAVQDATHFNPVDLVVSLRDATGRAYELSRYVDPESGIVVTKSDRGQRLRALELPGLWNGSMAGWNTVFLEVPIETFTPVKTVLDLLRPPHRQGGSPAGRDGAGEAGEARRYP